MKKNHFFTKLLQITAIAGTLIAAAPSQADDTDVYLNSAASSGTPLVMFSLDYRANLGSTICSAGALAASYFHALADLSTALDTFDCPSAAYLTRIPQIAPDIKAMVDLGKPLDLFDVLNGALKAVLNDINNVQVGLMMNHKHRNNCEGPDGASTVGCSNGGYIVLGFEELLPNDTNQTREVFYRTLETLNTISDNEFIGGIGGGSADSDGDGIPDSDDQCPDIPQGSKPSKQYPGCPRGSKPTAGSGGGNTAEDHSYQGKELFFEFFRYLTGQDVYNGHVGWADYHKDKDEQNLQDDTPLLRWDRDIEIGTEDGPSNRYATPLNVADCSKIFTVNLMFQVSQQEDDSDAVISANKTNGGMDGIDLSGANNSFDTVIRYLNSTDLADGSFGTAPDIAGEQNVTSYFVVFDKLNVTTKGYAQAGGTGLPIEINVKDPLIVAKLVEQLTEIFREILSVSTTFVAASIPVNVFNRAETEDELFLALFQAEETDYWTGNVKKLKIASSGSSRSIVDANGELAVGTDGRIKYSALTAWSRVEDSAGNALLPTDPNDENFIEGKDGRHVNRGGAGQNIPGYIADTGVIGDNNSDGDRKVYTNIGSSLIDMDVDPSPLTPSALLNNIMGTMGWINPYDANDMVRYMRGLDLDDLDNDNDESDARPWLFGDPLHSKPYPLNYGAYNDAVAGQYSTANPAIYVAVASDDGGVRLIRNTNPDGSESGAELWSFIPSSTYEIQDDLRANVGLSGGAHPYGMDGSPIPVFMRADAGASTVDSSADDIRIVVGQRRGGKNYYALDVSDPNTPDLSWRITPSSSGFSNLGYTFSTPQVGKIQADAGDKNALIFAGGYDTNKDSAATDDSQGNSLFIVDAETGTLIKALTHADFVDSTPSDVTIADTDGDGLIDRALFGDTGGNIWRADFYGTQADWKLSHLAKLGRHGSTDSTDRRFFHAPDLIQSKDNLGSFDAIVMTSGNRADPLGVSTQDYAFMLKDRNIAVGTGAPIGPSSAPLELGHLADVTDNCIGDGNCTTTPDLTYGWSLKLEATGEKGLAVPFTFGGVIYFTTYLPPAAGSGPVCGAAEGSGRLYAVNLQDATPAKDYSSDPDSKTDRYDPLDSGGIPAEVVFVPPGKILKPDLSFEDLDASNRFRTYWQLLEPDVNG